MALFPPLATRSLPTALVSHSQSCCPTMDVALLSNPTNATGNASIQLYRLSGGSNTPVTPSLTYESTHSSSKVWETSIDNKAVVVAAPVPTSRGRAKSATSGVAAAGATYIQPRKPESLQWQPDGMTFAFASTTSNYMLYSVHDGRPVLSSSPLASPEEQSIYLLNCESTLPSGTSLKKEPITAERLVASLPKLSEVKKVHEKVATKAGTFVNPFAAGFSKPYVPTKTFTMGRFPEVFSAPAPNDESGEETDLIPDPETEQALGLVENPSILTLVDEAGNLHLLYQGGISLGSISLGEGVDVIAAPVSKVITRPKTPFHPVSYALEICLLASMPCDRIQTWHRAIAAALPQTVPTSEEASAVFELSIQLPLLPSTEVSMLARASTCIKHLLSHAFEAFDEARKGWEEVRGMGNKWLDRIRDDSVSLLPELQLTMLLLTGRPSNTNMHEYFASKNTERNLENWEANQLKAAARIRDTAYQHLTPVCERLTLWLSQLRGWALWPARFGRLELDLEQIEQCTILVRLIMMRLTALEDMALEEEIGFREFCGWVKFDLERISAIEANADGRPSPKHDVLAVMSYIRQKLPSNPIDGIMVVEDDKAAAAHTPVLEHWLQSQRLATSRSGIAKEGEGLSNIVLSIAYEYSELGLDSDALLDLGKLDLDAITTGRESLDSDFETEEVRLFTNPPPMPAKPQPTQHTRRKSTNQAELKHLQCTSPIELPISFLLRDLARRLRHMFDHSFAMVAKSATVGEVKHIVTWQPPGIEEDDALAVLGLARDPTKITARMIRAVNGDAEPSLFIACETPPGSLPSHHMDQPAFWIFRSIGDTLAAQAFALLGPSDNVPYEILDIDFFDDKEVVLLLRNPAESTMRSRYSLATVAYQSHDLTEVVDGNIGVCLTEALSPIPLQRVHRFEASFEPLQLSLNGRAGRRIAAVLGSGGKMLEVLDMEDPEDEEEEGMDATEHDITVE